MFLTNENAIDINYFTNILQTTDMVNGYWYVINDISGKPKRNPVKSFKKKIILTFSK